MKKGNAPDAARAPGPVAAGPSVVDEAGRQLRAPWAASVAGLLFAVLFTLALLLVRNSPLLTAGDAELARLFAEGKEASALIGSLYLAPFAGIMFLWFIAVIRDQLGEREDRFFATIFFGSGVLFVALVFVAMGVGGSFLVGVRYLDQPPPPASTIALLRTLSYTLLFAFATRAGAVFLFATATVGLRSRMFPRWFALAGYLLGVLLLVVVAVWDWIILVLPVWVAVVSLYILRRERERQRAA